MVAISSKSFKEVLKQTSVAIEGILRYNMELFAQLQEKSVLEEREGAGAGEGKGKGKGRGKEEEHCRKRKGQGKGGEGAEEKKF
jgi:hypothetical protein